MANSGRGGRSNIIAARQLGALWVLCACGYACAAASATAGASAPLLHLTTEERPPTSMLVGGEVVGMATDRIRQMMARAQVAVDIRIFPWMRAYSMALSDPNTCVYATRRMPAREASFQWVGPVATSQWVLYGTAKRRLTLNTLDDARAYTIGSYLGDSVGERLKADHFKVDMVGDDALNANKLLLDRIDLWVGTPSLSVNNWGGRIVPVLTFNKVELYLACNRGVPSALIARLNATLEQMRRDGSTKAIDKKYGGAP